MNPVTTALDKAKQSTSPFIGIFTWACIWVFSVDDPTGQVIAFYNDTDPLKLGFGGALVVGSLFLNLRKKKKVVVAEPTDEVEESTGGD